MEPALFDLCRKYGLPKTVAVANSIDDALEQSVKQQDIDQIFLIGGKTPFEEGLKHPACDRIYYTKVFTHFDCDTFMSPIDATEFQMIEERVGLFCFIVLVSRSSLTNL